MIQGQRSGWLHALVPALLLVAIACERQALPVVRVEQGPFEVRLREAGTISALNSTTIDVPALRMNMQILWLIEEGSQVVPGDTLVKFDTSEASKQVEEKEAGLELALAALRKGVAEHEAGMAELKSTMTYDSISWRLSRMQADRTRFESEVARQEAELQFHQSTLALEKSLARSRSQEAIGQEGLSGLRLRVSQAQSELAQARTSLQQMTATAPGRGMVVYLPIWKGDRMGKVKVGDSPWRGSSILELPDFDTMLVDLKINEVDFNLLRLGDSCEVVLDAWPDRRFAGRVLDMGVLARDRDDESGLKAFDVRVRVSGSDSVLKPGMNARVTIFGFRVEDAFTVPVEALHQDDEGWFVWLVESGATKRQAVEPGPSNGDRIQVRAGLAAGQEVRLDNFQAGGVADQARQAASPPRPDNGTKPETRGAVGRP